MLIEAGKYTAELGGQVVIYDAESGALCAALPVRVADGPAKDTALKHTMTIVKRDGSLNPMAIETLKAVFGWDGADPFWLADNGAVLSGVQFSISVENELVTDDFGNQLEVSKIKWLDPLGGKVLKMPEMADRRSVLAKYGSMFRATATPKRATPMPSLPVAPATPAVPAAPPIPSKLVLRPAAAVLVTADEAWAAFVKGYGDKAEQAWGTALASLGITGEPTAAQSAALKLHAEGDDIPFDGPAAAVAAPTLDEATIAKLEAAIGENGPAAVAWMFGQKWLQAGQGLAHLSATRAGQILARPAQFLRAVKGA